MTGQVVATYHQFRSWAANANPGDQVTYYKGALSHFRYNVENAKSVNKQETKFAQNTLAICDAAFKWGWQGHVHLKQRRLALGKFEYICESVRKCS
jgi:hypothetical protein